MSENMTKAEARKLLAAKNDSELARVLDMARSRMSMLAEDEPVSDGVQWRVRAIMAERELYACQKERPRPAA